MQSTFGIIFLAIVDNQPRILPLAELLRHFVDHRKTVVIRRTQFDLKKAEERAHLLRGLALALANIDLVIKIIRASKDPKEAKDRLTAEVSMTRAGLEKFIGMPLGDSHAKGKEKDLLRLDDVQAQAILDMRLQRLTGLEREKIVAEFKEVLALIAKLQEILGSEKLVLDIIVGELHEIKKQFGDERRTQIVAEATDIDIEDLIVEEDMVITVSRGGYIKRSPLSLYRAQRRGGKGRIGATTKEEDVVEHLFVASTHAYILAFTSTGPHALDQGLRPAAARPGDARQGDRQPAEPRPERAHRGDGRDEGLPGGPLPRLRDEERPRQEDGAFGVLERPLGRHHRDQPRGGRRAALRAHHRRRAADLHRDAPGPGHPVLARRTCARWAATRPA